MVTSVCGLHAQLNVPSTFPFFYLRSMLLRIHIQNYAIIDELELSFSKNLTVITGETGAGKSIAMEALSLVLGERADTNVLFDKSKKCAVEAEFDSVKTDLKSFFETNDLDEEATLTLRREISPAGKSRAFINDTPVNLPVMKQLGDLLVDMHQQHESQEISTTQFQLSLLDSLAKQEQAVKKYRSDFTDYQKKMQELLRLKEQHLRETQELDYLHFQLNELSAATLKNDEQETLEMELQQLEHAEEIQRTLAGAIIGLKDSDPSVVSQLKSVISSLNALRRFYPEAEELLKRLESARIELNDIAGELEKQQEQINMNPTRLEEVQNRLDLIFRLQKKHRTNDVASLIGIENALQKRIDGISIQTEHIEELEQETSTRIRQLVETARELSAARVKQIPKVVQTINSMLKDVGMIHAQIKIDHHRLDENQPGANGLDEFDFLFASNKGSTFHEIRKVASGGELSRLMLCFKSLIASSTALPTLIFDEIDAGISGETAVKVSAILKQLASRHQVICITHLPQLAAKGDTHYFVYKETHGGRTHTRVRSLTQDEKVKTIAQMISGEKVTPAALESARELLN